MQWLTNFITSHISKAYVEELLKKSSNDYADGLKKCEDNLSKMRKKISEVEEKNKQNLESVKITYDAKISELSSSIKGNIATHVVKMNDKSVTVSGITHEMFDTVLAMVNNDLPVFLSGPAGCGKNHLCKQIAEALGLNFYFTNAVTQEYRLTGFIDANGKYHETEFYKACKYGGLFMLDEIDGSIPEVLILLNAAIANRYFDFPNGRIDLHPDFRIIAAGNTTGTGGNASYTGRTRLDAASLDRFCLVKMNYSTTIEKAITNNNLDLIKFIHDLRQSSSLIISYRALNAITVLENNLPLSNVIRMCITKGIPTDSLKTIQESYRTQYGTQSRYAKALLSL